MRLLWVRHGQMLNRAHEAPSFETVNRSFTGADHDLSDRGRVEAEILRRYFERHPVDAVYSSPLRRARQTAEPTARALGVGVGVLDEIAELRTGRLPPGSGGERVFRLAHALPLVPPQAKRNVVGALLIPLFFRAWQAGRTVGGETRAELDDRLDRCYRRLRADHAAGARVALFSHGYLIFVQAALGVVPRRARAATWRRPYVPNASITELELPAEGPPRLVRYADDRHVIGG